MLGFMVKRRWKRSTRMTGKSEEKTFSKTDLEKYFDRQATKLLNPEFYSDSQEKMPILSFLLDLLRKKIPDKIVCEENNLPLLISVGQFIPLDQQLVSMQINQDYSRYYMFNPSVDSKYIPSWASARKNSDLPYLLFDVEPGWKTKGLKEGKCRMILSIVNRLGLTLHDLVALITHFPELRHSYLGSLETHVVSDLPRGSGIAINRSSIYIHEKHVILPQMFGEKNHEGWPIKILMEESVAKEDQSWPSCKIIIHPC